MLFFSRSHINNTTAGRGQHHPGHQGGHPATAMAPEELSGSADYDYPLVTNMTVNQEVFSRWEVIFTTIFIPILYSFIFLLGLMGNLFVIVLMAKRRGNKRMVDTFVLNLAVADVIFICTLPFWVAAGARGNRWPLGEGLCKVSSYAIAVNRCSSILFLTALSMERYLVIKKVLDTKMMGSQRHIRITCGIIWAASLLLGAPSLVYRRLDGDDCWDEDGEDFSLAMVFLTFLLPLGVISFCYCSIYCRLQRHVRLGRGIRRSHRAIVTIVAAFLCSWLPLNTCKVLLFFLAKGTLVLSQGQEVALRWVVAGSTCLAFVNSCVNPLVYALMDGRCRPRCPRAPGTGPGATVPSSTTDSSLLFGVRIWIKPPPGPRRRSGTQLRAAPGVPRDHLGESPQPCSPASPGATPDPAVPPGP
ncbi:probable G-protein coupled receptor 25 isoform X1 [Cuculus canorus]|uniref:probable G-protein coupled receptor 25 isoform X1 n=2 Tax=Cuculus canorus TaxID=55661 RepID=UPI0023AADDFE|nr:probable G-protein coupled receptor 25 isoform X1 [Cuculus canorus]XP_053943935.1 probable G-protein coupled receptor 25 isoform X1 [Cuculus canorus]